LASKPIPSSLGKHARDDNQNAIDLFALFRSEQNTARDLEQVQKIRAIPATNKYFSRYSLSGAAHVADSAGEYRLTLADSMIYTKFDDSGVSGARQASSMR
jgi:hypothetical protein